MAEPTKTLRDLPAMHQLLAEPALAPWVQRVGRSRARRLAAATLDALRAAATQGAALPDASGVRAAVLEALQQAARPRLRRVINATGVVLHTGLGRAPLAEEALQAIAAVATGYSNLELDLDSGRRGHRSALVEPLLRELAGAEAALVVNNNAAAVLLVLTALAQGREALVSRGELVEIGGGFRVPEVMAQSGALLREVGTTNRTHLRDYQAGIGPETALVLKVHQSNFRQLGFTSAPPLAALAELAHRHGLPLVYDLGSGHMAAEGEAAALLAEEPEVRQALAAGADVVTFSGDKLLGGPQAGIICGRADLVARCAAHPLQRALRVDKLTLAALEATLRLYLGGQALQRVPALHMLTLPEAAIAARAEALAEALRQELADLCAVEVRPQESQAGGGALAARPVPTRVVTVRPLRGAARLLAARLRQGEPAVVARVEDEQVLLDPRTLLPEDAPLLPALVAAAARDSAGRLEPAAAEGTAGEEAEV